jgi:hypothetical protein
MYPDLDAITAEFDAIALEVAPELIAAKNAARAEVQEARLEASKALHDAEHPGPWVICRACFP